MGSLTGAVIAAAVAWASILLAVVLPIPEYVFRRLRWVGAASLAIVGFTMMGGQAPSWTPAAVLVTGAAWAFAWPRNAAAAIPSLQEDANKA